MPTTTETHVTVDGTDTVRVPVPPPEDHEYETTAVEGTFRRSTGILFRVNGRASRSERCFLPPTRRRGRTSRPRISGTWGMKGVRRLNPIALDPEEHPE
jgi:hypothetical protein